MDKITSPTPTCPFALGKKGKGKAATPPQSILFFFSANPFNSMKAARPARDSEDCLSRSGDALPSELSASMLFIFPERATREIDQRRVGLRLRSLSLLRVQVLVWVLVTVVNHRGLQGRNSVLQALDEAIGLVWLPVLKWPKQRDNRVLFEALQ